MIEKVSACPGCDGSGFYVPAFSPDVLVDCLGCNADGSMGPDDEDDDYPAPPAPAGVLP